MKLINMKKRIYMMNKKINKFIHKVFQKIYIKEHIRKMKKINKNNK